MSASRARLWYSVLLLMPVAPVISEMVCTGRLLEVDALASGALERVDLTIGPLLLSRHPRIPESHIAPILVPETAVLGNVPRLSGNTAKGRAGGFPNPSKISI